MGDPNPPTPELYQDGRGWVTGYLVVHMMSIPSRRYPYALWFAIILIFILMTVFHWTGARYGFIGAKWTKWAIRRRTWRLSTRHPTSLAPNGQLACLAFLPIAAVLLCFVGPDYISPNVHVFDLNSRALSYSYWDPNAYIQFQPTYTISKNWWTSGGRVGLISFALFPICILFALKAPPFAVFAIPFATQIHFDKLAWLHRWTGRLIWIITVIHVALWSVQLYRDRRPSTSVMVYKYAWLYPKFLWGWTAFGCLTLLIILSFPFLRKSHYETFYFFHVASIVGTLVFSALHHPPVAIWCWISLGLWGAERVYRFARWLHINSFLFPQGVQSRNRPNKAWEYSDIRPEIFSYPPSSHPSRSLLNTSMADSDQYYPPPGFAQAELVSGATVRLTYMPARPISWAPGQHFLINIPSVARLTTHPFTVASAYDEQSVSRPLTFFIRCKNGWTRDLWHHVAELSDHGQILPPKESLPPSSVPPKSGVLLRTYIDGPFGSSARTQWGSYTSVMIVVGGSGVSFGLSILEYLCLCLAGQYHGSHSGMGSHAFQTRRVRFIWLVREFAHLQWCASILCRCRDTVPRQALQIDIFVTNFQSIANNPFSSPNPNQRAGEDSTYFSLPLSPFAKGASTELDGNSLDDDVDLNYYTRQFGDEETHDDDMTENYTMDLTEFDGDNDAALPGEDILNRRVGRVSTIRRAKTRKAKTVKLVSPIPPPPQSSSPNRASYQSSDGLFTSHRFSVTRHWDFDDDLGNISPTISTMPRVPSPSRGNPDGASTTTGRSHRFSANPEDFVNLSQPGTPLSASPLPPNQDAGADAHPRLHVDQQELRDVSVISELARPGKPKLDRILSEEVEKSKGALLVACCGPTSLNAIVRKTIAAGIDPTRVRRGDERGFISLVSEDFAY